MEREDGLLKICEYNVKKPAKLICAKYGNFLRGKNPLIIHHPVHLKVLTNEKRGGLTIVLFDRSTFRLFTVQFSNKSIQSSSCERPKTAQRTLFLLFESNS
jgi:hypothetical protein